MNPRDRAGVSPQRVFAAAPPQWKAWWSRPLGRVLDHVVYRTSVAGRENIPTDGPVIFAANHLSFLDGPVMVGAANRYMHVMVRHDMFKGFLGWVLNSSGQIPVNRDGDRRGLQCAKDVLGRGGCVGILPEGTRGTGDAAHVNGGVAWLALNSGAAVVPVAILGTRVGHEPRNTIPKPRRHLYVVFGEPLRIEREPGVTGRVSMDRATERIQLRLAGHIQAATAATGQDLPTDDHQTSKHKGHQP